MPALKTLPFDPWRRPYQWDDNVIFSFGADEKENTNNIIKPFKLKNNNAIILNNTKKH